MGVGTEVTFEDDAYLGPFTPGITWRIIAGRTTGGEEICGSGERFRFKMDGAVAMLVPRI